MTKLFIGGFPLDINELDLVKLVSPYGTVSTIKIVRDKKTKMCKGYAFLEITDLHGAEQIIEALNTVKYKGRELSISIKEDAPAETAPKKRIGNYSPTTERPRRPRLK